MWIVYNKEDSPECGFTVGDEKESKKFCKENPGYKYCFTNMFDNPYYDYYDNLY